MTDWRRIAEANGIQMNEQAMAVAEARLSALETKLDKLTTGLEPGDEPAVIFRPEVER